VHRPSNVGGVRCALGCFGFKRHIQVAGDVRYLTIGQVRERFGVSDMWVWRDMKYHGFPQPVQFGGKTGARNWLLSDIEKWKRERVKLAGVKS
jgi:predicted DNA-binding transcriptional regulator AlpA